MLNKQNRFLSLISSNIAILFLLSACLQSHQEEFAKTTMFTKSSPTSQVLLSATATAKPPQITPTEISSPTLPPKAICPDTDSQVTVREARTAAEIEQSVLEYLNQGGSTERLQKELNELNDKAILGPSQVFMLDTNNDEVKEILLAISFGPAPVGGDYMDVHSNLNLYNCANGKYDITQIVAGEFADTLRVLTIENLLNSNTPEILISRRWTYLDTSHEFVYYELVELYLLTEEGWVLAFQSPDFRCGIETELRNGGNGHRELVIIGKNHCPSDSPATLSSTKLTYEFDDDEVRLINEELVSSP